MERHQVPGVSNAVRPVETSFRTLTLRNGGRDSLGTRTRVGILRWMFRCEQVHCQFIIRGQGHWAFIKLMDENTSECHRGGGDFSGTFSWRDHPCSVLWYAVWHMITVLPVFLEGECYGSWKTDGNSSLAPPQSPEGRRYPLPWGAVELREPLQLLAHLCFFFSPRM